MQPVKLANFDDQTRYLSGFKTGKVAAVLTEAVLKTLLIFE